MYKNQYIAYNENGVIAQGENLTDVLKLGEKSGEYFLIYVVPPRHSIQILPIRF